MVVTLALALRLLHLRLSAKVLLTDDAVFFEEHARRFLAAWASFGTADFLPALRLAVEHASLQGVLYPLMQSIVYLLAGGINHMALLLVQTILGTLTVWLTYLATRQAVAQRTPARPPAEEKANPGQDAEVAALVAGGFVALYPPLVISSGLLLAEALFTFLQALALYLLVRGLPPTPGAAHPARPAALPLFLGGSCIGLLMLRPALQYAGPLLLLGLLCSGAISADAISAGSSPGQSRLGLAGRRVRVAWRLAAPYLAGLALVALPWLAINGLVFGSFVWSRTGDAWQQVYWGIYPPNRGWWPPDSPVPPKYGVESLPGAWAAGAHIQPQDLDYLAAAIDQVRATPLKALATEVNKVYQAYLHPFDVYAERPVVVGPLATPVHRLLIVLTLAGLSLAWLRPAPLSVLAAGLVASTLPFLASHIDVRYTVPPSQAAAPFAGLAVAQLVRCARTAQRTAQLSPLLPLFAVTLPLVAWGVSVPRILAVASELAPWHAHLAQTAVMCLAFIAAGLGAGGALARDFVPPRTLTPGGAHALEHAHGQLRAQPHRRAPAAGASASEAARRCLASGLAAGGLLAGLYSVQALYDGDWRQWQVQLRPGDAVRQTLVLPAAWQPPPGSRAELRLYLQGSSAQTYEPVVRVNGQEVARLGPAFTAAGPLRFWERIMVVARQQGKSRAEVPQWYAMTVDPALLAMDMGGRVQIELDVEPLASESGLDAWVRLWGDYAAAPGARTYDGPAVYSRIQGADEAFLKFTATGEYGIWRRTPLLSVRTEPARRRGAAWPDDDLSDAPGRQLGEYRIRLLVLGPGGDLVALF